MKNAETTSIPAAPGERRALRGFETERFHLPGERAGTFLSSTVPSAYNRAVMPRNVDSEWAVVSLPARIAGEVIR
jgi:hypothetical protein